MIELFKRYIRNCKKYIEGNRLQILKVVIFMTAVMTAAILNSYRAETATGLKIYDFTVNKANVYTDKQVLVTLNKVKISKPGTPGILVDGIALVPYDDIFRDSSIEADCIYHKGKGTISISKNGKTITMTIGSRKATVNKKAVTLPVAPMRVKYVEADKEKILVPSRYVSETLGLDYTWLKEKSTVAIECAITKEKKTGTAVNTPSKKSGKATVSKPSKAAADNNGTANGTATTLLQKSGDESAVGICSNTHKLYGSNISTGMIDSVARNYTNIRKNTETFVIHSTQPFGEVTSKRQENLITVQTAHISCAKKVYQMYGNSSSFINTIATTPATKGTGSVIKLDVIPGAFAYDLSLSANHQELYITIYLNSVTTVNVGRNSSGDYLTLTGLKPLKVAVTEEKNYLLLDIPETMNGVGDINTNITGAECISQFNMISYSGKTQMILRLMKGYKYHVKKSGNKYTIEIQPTPSPTTKPSATVKPTPSPTTKPSATVKPTPSPTTKPSATVKPTPSPTTKPSATVKLTPSPTTKPSATAKPTPTPTIKPSATVKPTPSPTIKPSATNKPTPSPSAPSPTTKPSTTNKPTPSPSTPSPTTKPSTTNQLKDTIKESSDSATIRQVKNKSKYEIVIPLPKEIKISTISDEDFYYENYFKISLPGDYTSFYKDNKISCNSSVVRSITVSLNSRKETVIKIATTKLQGYEMAVDDNHLYVNVGNPSDIYKNIVVLDPGHGGIAQGAQYYGTKEKDVNLKILYSVGKSYFNRDTSKLKVYYTRTSDKDVSLSERAAFAKTVGADLFVSLHMNASDSGVSGTEVFYSSRNNAAKSTGLCSRSLAIDLSGNLTKNLGTNNRGVKAANFQVISTNTVPAVLIELGFLSNKEEHNKLVDPEYQELAVKTIYNTLIQVFEKYPTGR